MWGSFCNTDSKLAQNESLNFEYISTNLFPLSLRFFCRLSGRELSEKLKISKNYEYHEFSRQLMF